MRRLIGYLKITIKLLLILQAYRVNVLKWWVEASYVARDSMQGHTGGTMSMVKDGRGSIISILRKQKLNTKSLLEVELIGADDAMPHIIWTRYFLEAQGYGINKNILYQDNMSAMLLKKNGKKSSIKNTRRIKPFQHQGRQRARATRRDTGLIVPSRIGKVTVHRYPMH